MEERQRSADFSLNLRWRQWHPFWEWFGLEDTTLSKQGTAADRIDFTPYTKIFLPWHQSPIGSRAAAPDVLRKAVRRQKAQAECYMYEISTPFYRPTHYVDITELLEDKRRLIRFTRG